MNKKVKHHHPSIDQKGRRCRTVRNLFIVGIISAITIILVVQMYFMTHYKNVSKQKSEVIVLERHTLHTVIPNATHLTHQTNVLNVQTNETWGHIFPCTVWCNVLTLWPKNNASMKVTHFYLHNCHLLFFFVFFCLNLLVYTQITKHRKK